MRSPIARVLIAASVTMLTLSCARTPTGPNGNPWRFLPGHVESFSYAPFRSGRQCWVYLPPGYAQSDQRYPVLYLNDGESAFDVEGAFHVNRICEDLIRRGEMARIIVVAIESGGGHQRYVDYTPWTASYWAPNGGGDFYLRAIRDTLKPELDRRYRTLPDPTHTAMGGYSLGGLISAYAAYAYDSTFGRVGAFSPTYECAAGSTTSHRLGGDPRTSSASIRTPAIQTTMTSVSWRAWRSGRDSSWAGTSCR